MLEAHGSVGVLDEVLICARWALPTCLPASEIKYLFLLYLFLPMVVFCVKFVNNGVQIEAALIKGIAALFLHSIN